MILLIDNYDSFVHNLARYLQELGRSVLIRRNRGVTVEEIRSLTPEAIVISPGPCDPSKAGVSTAAVSALHGRVPILGICLGHQAIGAALGGCVVRALEPIHGMASPIHHDGEGIFHGLPTPFAGGRYHSLIIDPFAVPPDFLVAATTPDGRGGQIVMAIRHRTAPTIGLQFHPESVLTEHGHRLLANFLALADQFNGQAATLDRRGGAALPPSAAAPLLSTAIEPIPGDLGAKAVARAASLAGAARAGLAGRSADEDGPR